MKLVVTGAHGLIGTRLVATLEARGHAVLALGRGERRIASAGAYASVELGDEAAVRELFGDAGADCVVHTASMTEVDRCEKDPEGAHRSNVVATANVARAARALGAHLVHVSTDYVFSGERGPYAEDDVPAPVGVYALTKHMAEQTVRVLAGSWAIARTAVVFGWPPSSRPNFGSWLYQSLSRGERVKLFSDQWITPTWAQSAAQMLAELAERRLEGIWHTCGAEAVSRVEFGHALCERFGFERTLIEPVGLDAMALAGPRPRRAGLQTQKTRQSLEAKPLSIDDALNGFAGELGRSR